MWILLLVLLAAAAVAVIYGTLYVKTPANLAFIRTGLGGKRVCIDRGALILPVVQHIQWISLETLKLEVYKSAKEALITKDKFRVNVGAEFYVKIEPTPEAIMRASRSLGERSFNAEALRGLVEEKLVAALRAVVASRELMELHENRRGFGLAVLESVKEPLAANGLTLEDVSIFHLDQTEKSQLDPTNIFDAEGLKQITAQTAVRTRERNEIERNTEIAIKKKEVETVKLKLQLDEERDFAEAEQLHKVEVNRATKKAETEKIRYEQERLARQAEIEKERLIKELEIQREARLIQQSQVREQAEIEKEKILEEARRLKEVAILIRERERLEEERRRLEAEALKAEADQAVVTAAERAAAERVKEVALIQALREVEVAQKKAEAAQQMALAKTRDGEAEAQVRSKLRAAENVLEDRIINRDVLLTLIERSPQILAELMAPAKQIDSIKVLDVRGWPGGNGGGDGHGGVAERVVGSVLSAGAALPLLKELLQFAGTDAEKAIKGILEKVPGLKDVLGEQKRPGTA